MAQAKQLFLPNEQAASRITWSYCAVGKDHFMSINPLDLPKLQGNMPENEQLMLEG